MSAKKTSKNAAASERSSLKCLENDSRKRSASEGDQENCPPSKRHQYLLCGEVRELDPSEKSVSCPPDNRLEPLTESQSIKRKESNPSLKQEEELKSGIESHHASKESRQSQEKCDPCCEQIAELLSLQKCQLSLQPDLQLLSQIPPEKFLNEFLIPCLEQDEEKILCSWLLKANLLKTSEKCKSSKCKCQSHEGSSLEEIQKCSKCEHYFEMKKNAFFKHSRCGIKDALYCALAWCKEIPSHIAAQRLDIDETVVMTIYARCLETVSSVMATEGSEGVVLGGIGSVVLVDLWPNGAVPGPLPNEVKRSYKDRIRVLWLADTNHVPVRLWPLLLPPCRPPQDILQNLTRRFSVELDSPVGVPIKSGAGDLKDDVISDYDNPLIQSENGQISSSDETSDLKHSSEGVKRRDLRILKEHQETETQTPKSRGPLMADNGSSKELSHAVGTETALNDSFIREKLQLFVVPRGTNQSQDRGKKKKRKKDKKEKPDITGNEEHLKGIEITEAVLSVVHNHLAPGSLILANEEAIPNIVNILRASGRYEAVISVQDILAVNDEGYQPTVDILANIWKSASSLCMDLASRTRLSGARAIQQFQWRKIYGSDTDAAAYYLLSQIGSHYSPKVPIY